MKRFTGILGGASLLAASGALVAAAAAGTATGAVVTAQPFAKMVNHAFAAPPTTAECVAQLGLACYGPNQIEAAYDMPALYANGLTGKGKTIVIVDSFGSPTIGADLKKFDAAYHLPAPPSFTVIQPAGPVPPFDSTNGTMVGWAEETSLDVEYSHSMAPGANILLVETPVAETEGVAGLPQMMSAEKYVIDHHLGDVISQSFGATEQTFPSASSLMALRYAFVDAQKHDVTVVAGSGDAGATDYSNAAGTIAFTHRVTSWPASDPLVTAVGGTQLHLNAAGQEVFPTNVWNDTNLLGELAAGGGGKSVFFPRPSYQNGVSSVVGNARGVPDISLSAAVDGGVNVYMSFIPAGFYLIGGTSEATPLFAGVVAVADQAAGHDLGLLNPKLYAIGPSAAGPIPDITTGNNTVSFVQNGKDHTVPGWVAVGGYDLASGLGTVDGAQLVTALAAK